MLGTIEANKTNQFLGLKTNRELAALLEVKYSNLLFILYRKDLSSQYREFGVAKRSGGERKICAPFGVLKTLQRKLANILLEVYQAKAVVHSFCSGKSILTNAQTHVRKRHVLTLDLKDFFPSINYGRVRGMFMGVPYKLPSSVASVLAQLCCFQNALPQGAPTSPIISNMICAKMDSQLTRIAKRTRATYTRYADDITFSTNRRLVPDSLVATTREKGETIISAGSVVANAVETNGFTINGKKTFLADSFYRQKVTGITVNKEPNIPRDYVRQIRSVLHAWEKYGYEDAAKVHFAKYYRKQRLSDMSNISLRKVLAGRIDHVKFIKGSKNVVYRKLASKFNELIGKGYDTVFDDPIKEINAACWVLESDSHLGNQGTGFMLEGFGLVTCSHVLTPDTQAFHPSRPEKTYPVKVIAENKHVDLAILDIEAPNPHMLQVSKAESPNVRDSITLAGFPNYRYGDQAYVSDAKIAALRVSSGVRWILINTPIIAGNSGGPVLDASNHVVGVAARGADKPEDAHDTENHGAIRVEMLNELKERHKE